MVNQHRFIVSREQVMEKLGGEEPVVLADCRFQLGQQKCGQEAYAAGHLPGAVYFDLEEDLSGPVGEHGGRHPMPDLGVLLLKLGERGIDRNTAVIAYDDQGGAMAARFWWLLRFLGHEKVYLLDGGYRGWVQAGLPVSSEPAAPAEPKVFGGRVQNQMLVVMEDVRERLDRPGTVLIDSREPRRYRGEEEAIDKKAGHIPGARNRFWKDNLGADGRWLPPEELKTRFGDIAPDQEIIVYCGSGVTACPNLLALAEAGRTDARLYLGSWSDWISYPENPVTTGEE
ncbi:sulfurtransferase [Paenibacillus sp. YN15]|uniref:sulfurtransferase n=1 Tax=Paenibacillus sp. YN15 TaxID=1742774 RepID=UPI000DCE6BEE|nr:sulfurtransferase [Paenibacillus sp. YN15]RAU94930.1 sulfurtransferase [Paenibacillus sp. YN15]